MKKFALGVLFIGLLVACDKGKTVTIVDSPPLPDTPGGEACNPLMQTGCEAGQKCATIIDQERFDADGDGKLTSAADKDKIAHIGCAPDGDKQVDQGCSYQVGPKGNDIGHSDCVKGSECIRGICKAICDPQETAGPNCGATTHRCGSYVQVFENPDGTTAAGVCDPLCDPLTQTTLAGGTAACQSVQADRPNLACYGDLVTFSCSGTQALESMPGRCSGNMTRQCNADTYNVNECTRRLGLVAAGITPFRCCPASEGSCTFDATLMRTDRVKADGPASGGAYRNGCAAGFIPAFIEMTGSTVTICAGLCSPLKTDSSLVVNAVGSPTVPAKLPTAAAPVAGDGRCTVNRKGSEAQQNCLFAWQFNIEMNMLIDTPYNDTLGVCFGPNHYNYDHDGDAATMNINFPNCANLPPFNMANPQPPANCTENMPPTNPRSFSGTGCVHGLAHEWGCYNVADSLTLAFDQKPITLRNKREMRFRPYGDGEGRRHLIH